ncbi:hypothetical protein [Pseudomonas sp. TCU-HL1]|uniref:hypothetical protein n=1 Tax=Pseudomonas sp. TCU-HL1 TaxID=1856685 RepID=UPI00083CDED3|nr:hypothetical protein [Pseudomonas sp. TCU-HL1]AOE85577.1 sugar ABC transporter substrate-binding protein [Pseudomonas sp. TCU-HL1]AOE85590.1 sugar ABC transporter substrate-binding protein [Pseudomonas sp. TCU-HL1]
MRPHIKRRLLRIVLKFPFPAAFLLMLYLLLVNLVGDFLIRASHIAIAHPVKFTVSVIVCSVVGIACFAFSWRWYR